MYVWVWPSYHVLGSEAFDLKVGVKEGTEQDGSTFLGLSFLTYKKEMGLPMFQFDLDLTCIGLFMCSWLLSGFTHSDFLVHPSLSALLCPQTLSLIITLSRAGFTDPSRAGGASSVRSCRHKFDPVFSSFCHSIFGLGSFMYFHLKHVLIREDSLCLLIVCFL